MSATVRRKARPASSPSPAAISRAGQGGSTSLQVPALRVLIIDDHAIVRDGLQQLLRRSFPAASFGEARNSIEAVEAVASETWDVVLLDLSIPGQSGIEVLKSIRTVQPATKVLVITMHPEDQYAVRVLRAGACGYLNKESASEEVVQAVKKVVAGGRYVSATMAESLAAGINMPAQKAPHETLSAREFEVFCALAKGATLTEIASQLQLSVKTISTYRARIMNKTDLKTNAAMVRYALKEGLV
jgi:two-component system, NarL family, invasion response regulator UvrY